MKNLMGKYSLALATALVLMCSSLGANAVVVTFDDLSEWSQPSTYQGYEWQHVGVLSNTSGYGSHSISGNNFGYAWCCGYTDLVYSNTGFFDFTSAYFGNLSGTGESFTIRGFSGATEIYTQVITPGFSPSLYTLGFLNVNKVQFGPMSGNLTMDDLVLNSSVVPEPASLALLGLGLAGLGFSRRKKA